MIVLSSRIFTCLFFNCLCENTEEESVHLLLTRLLVVMLSPSQGNLSLRVFGSVDNLTISSSLQICWRATRCCCPATTRCCRPSELASASSGSSRCSSCSGILIRSGDRIINKCCPSQLLPLPQPHHHALTLSVLDREQLDE